jgi:hypothetical protein
MGVADRNCVYDGRLSGGNVYREGHPGYKDERSRIHIEFLSQPGCAAARRYISKCRQFRLDLKDILWLTLSRASALLSGTRHSIPENERPFSARTDIVQPASTALHA